MGPSARVAEVMAGVICRTDELVQALGILDDAALLAPSVLPGWSRLTIACHLRYGATALHGMTQAVLVGEAASYYPLGRDRQRPGTLEPDAGEGCKDVVTSLGRCSAELHELWVSLTDEQWAIEVREPDDNVDLGPLSLGRLPLLRLIEVEVHGSDLDLGLSDWSKVFVDTALAFRLEWLNRRRSNHRPVDDAVEGSWLLAASDGPTYLVTVADGSVTSRPASSDAPSSAAIQGSSRDLLALLLGRPTLEPLSYSGDDELGQAFARAFPGP